jgi:outer membrane protein assembly factor BamB
MEMPTWFACLSLAVAPPGDSAWPQFRGPNCSGRAVGKAELPATIAPDRNVVWKQALPPGHSSPVVFGDRIYLTAVRQSKLVTMGLDRASGKTLWEAEASYGKLEKIHQIGSHAQCSPATDGARVVSFFGSSGLYCYDSDGRLLWKRPMGPFRNDFGAGNSPILSGDRVILCQDHDTDSFLMAIDKRTGETVWRTDRSEFPRNYCTPVIWESAGRRQIVLAATLRVVGYDFETGKELWTVRGISRTVCATPVVGDDGSLYAAGWSAGGDPTDRIRVEPFDTAVPPLDSNHNGTLEVGELPDGPIKQRFSQVDRDKTGSITRGEYEYFRGLFDKSRNVVLAIRPGGTGDVTSSHVAWEATRSVPFCASPLYEDGYVFTVKDGGILSTLDAKSGEPIKQDRIATGSYYASPVSGDGKVYLVNERGKLTVVSAIGDWEVLGTADFGEDTYATPAIVHGRIYLRTAGHLYCFGKK